MLGKIDWSGRRQACTPDTGPAGRFLTGSSYESNVFPPTQVLTNNDGTPRPPTHTPLMTPIGQSSRPVTASVLIHHPLVFLVIYATVLSVICTIHHLILSVICYYSSSTTIRYLLLFVIYYYPISVTIRHLLLSDICYYSSSTTTTCHLLLLVFVVDWAQSTD